MAIDINMFWHGPQLGPLHAACVRSFQRHGHTVFMHCYEAPADLPDGARVIDAEEVMPLSDLVAHRRSGSVALGTNRYRYRLIAAGYGLYSDCDMFCLRPIVDAPYIMGAEHQRAIGCAFLKFPPDSALSAELIAATSDEYFVPPWLRRSARRRLKLKRAIGRGVHVADMQWGVWGPTLFTHQVSKLGLQDQVSASDRYYPLHHLNSPLLSDPELDLADLVTSRTDAIHLWHHMLSKQEPPKGSPLHGIMTC